MSKHQDPLLEALQEGKSYTWTVPDGGDLASMRKAIQHGQTLTMSPIRHPDEIQVGDRVLVKWHGGYIFHIVGDIQGARFLIVNSLGKINGWVSGPDIVGRVTQVVEPEPTPSVPMMLAELEQIYDGWIQADQPAGDDSHRLSEVVQDLRWYAERIGSACWDTMPRSNKWSFQQHLWRLIKRAGKPTASAPDRIHYLIDEGKRCVGLASEIFALFEYNDPD